MVQMANPSATFILESVVRGHHIYKLDRLACLLMPGRKYQRRLMVVLSTIDNNKLIDCISVCMSTWHCHVINVLHMNSLRKLIPANQLIASS